MVRVLIYDILLIGFLITASLISIFACLASNYFLHNIAAMALTMLSLFYQATDLYRRTHGHSYLIREVLDMVFVVSVTFFAFTCGCISLIYALTSKSIF